jgi:hypothetical protein
MENVEHHHPQKGQKGMRPEPLGESQREEPQKSV